jgi:MFS transporter, FSR family, fosmidomycin resistance protein
MKMNKKALAILSFGHLFTDLNQGALPALLPYFKDTLNLSYTMSGVILLSTHLASSVIQPVFGYLSDKRPLGWLLPLAPFMACLGLSATGLTSNYPLLLLCAILSGIGMASFHPEGFKTASFFTGDRKATGMSFFTVGGNLGFSAGPILAITLVTHFGLKGTLGMILPGMIIAIVLLVNRSMLTAPVESAHREATKEKKPPLTRDQKVSFLILLIISTTRSWTQMGLVTYIPFYYINHLKGNPLYAGKLISTFLLAGVLGALVGAPFADRWGHKKFLLMTLIVPLPLLFLFFRSSGIISFFLLGAAGMVLIAPFALSAVMAQTLIPRHLGMVSGMMIGFTMSAGGMGVTVLGVIADHWGMLTALKVIFILPLIAFGVGLLLKYPLDQCRENRL